MIGMCRPLCFGASRSSNAQCVASGPRQPYAIGPRSGTPRISCCSAAHGSGWESVRAALPPSCRTIWGGPITADHALAWLKSSWTQVMQLPNSLTHAVNQLALVLKLSHCITVALPGQIACELELATKAVSLLEQEVQRTSQQGTSSQLADSPRGAGAAAASDIANAFAVDGARISQFSQEARAGALDWSTSSSISVLHLGQYRFALTCPFCHSRTAPPVYCNSR